MYHDRDDPEVIHDHVYHDKAITHDSRSTEIHGHFSVSRQGKCPPISSIIHVLDAEIQGHFQKQRCLQCQVLKEVFDHVRSKHVDPRNNYASTEQKTANYIDVDFQTPCVQ